MFIFMVHRSAFNTMYRMWSAVAAMASHSNVNQFSVNELQYLIGNDAIISKTVNWKLIESFGCIFDKLFIIACVLLDKFISNPASKSKAKRSIWRKCECKFHMSHTQRSQVLAYNVNCIVGYRESVILSWTHIPFHGINMFNK